jgi:hypothetical protein
MIKADQCVLDNALDNNYVGLSITGTNTKTNLMTAKLKTGDVNQANNFQLILLSEQMLQTNYAAVII